MKKIFVTLTLLLLSQTSFAGAKELFQKFDSLKLTTVEANGKDKSVSFFLLSCTSYLYSNGTRDYACWYQLNSGTAQQNDAKLLPTHADGKEVYLMLRDMGYKVTGGSSTSVIFLRPFSCKMTVASNGTASYACQNK